MQLYFHFRLPFQSQHISIMRCHHHIVIHMSLCWHHITHVFVPVADFDSDILYCVHFIITTLCLLQVWAHTRTWLWTASTILAVVFQTMYHGCTPQFRKMLGSIPKVVGLVFIVLVIGPSGNVGAAAYWLFQTRPASGKHSALQQLFRDSQCLLQSTAVLDSQCDAKSDPI